MPGRWTDLSRSPSATLTAVTFGSALAGGTDGGSVEGMRQYYEMITQWFMCSPSQAVLRRRVGRVRMPSAREAGAQDRDRRRMASGSGVS